MRAALLSALVAGALLAGCGIDPQAAPEDLDVPPIPSASSSATASSAGPELVLWFLRDDALVPVERSAPQRDPATALELLADGPTAEEAAAGLTTAISRQPLTVADDGAVLTVGVTPAFTRVAGADQLRAVAQVVWTATGFDDVPAVRFTNEDGALEVPTDDGLSSQPVDRDDYASLAPRDGATQPRDATPTPAPPTRTGRRRFFAVR